MKITKDADHYTKSHGRHPNGYESNFGTRSVRLLGSVYGVWVSRDEKSVLFTAAFIEHMMDYDVIFEGVQKLIKQESDKQHHCTRCGRACIDGLGQ